MKIVGFFFSMIFVLGLHAQNQITLNEKFVECRSFLQTLTEDNLPVMNQYDAFVATLQTAYKNGEGFIDLDLIRVTEALDFAAEKHRFQTRKGSEKLPYIIHPIGVAHYLMTIGRVRDVDILIAALLHDTVEDTETSLGDIGEQFGLRVAGFVKELTDDKSLPKSERKRLQVVNAPHKSAGAAQIKLADKLYNLRDLKGWEKERVDEYYHWSKRVVDALPWVNAPLKAAVDDQISTRLNG